MSDRRFRGWFSDVGFTSRVLIICDMMDELMVTWGAEYGSAVQEAIEEVRETAYLELDRYLQVGIAAGYLTAVDVVPRDEGIQRDRTESSTPS